jgi:glycosyltransferase involved in cell wall biosynthesis
MLKKYPKITCLCPTRGRFETLRESISFFLMQDYPNKELCIFNNHPTDITPHSKLAAHNIKVINAGDYRSNTITEIYRDALASISEDTEYVAIWDDDDAYFPWHLSANMEQLLKSNKDAIRAHAGFWQHNPEVTLISNNLEASMVVRKDLIFFEPLLDRKENFHPHLPWVDNVQKDNKFEYYGEVSAVFRWVYGRPTHHLQSVGPHKNNDDGSGQVLKPLAVEHIYYNAVEKASSDLSKGVRVDMDKSKWISKLSSYNLAQKISHILDEYIIA